MDAKPISPVNEYQDIIEEEEDNDGHDAHTGTETSGQTSSFAASMQIANTIMGAGILGLPVVMRYLGIILGSTLMIINAIVTIYSIELLMRCKDITNKYGYAMFAKITYQRLGSLAVKSAMILNNFGVCCAYFRIFGDVCSSLVALFVTDKTNFFCDNWNNFFYVICVVILMFPFIFRDNIETLENVSFLGVAGITIFFLSLVVIFFYKLANGMIEPFDSDMLYPNGKFLDVITEMPTIFVAFTFQFNAFPIYLTLKNKSNKEMNKSTTIGVMFCLLVYLITGLVGFFIYREGLTNTVLDNLRQEMSVYKDSNTFLFVTLIIVNVSFLLSSTMSIPLMFFSLKRNFLNTVIFCKKNFSKKKSNKAQNDNLTTPKINDQENLLSSNTLVSHDKITLSKKEQIVITILLYLSLCVVTITVKYMKEIFDIVGSTAANAINYIFPNLFILKLTHTAFCSKQNLLSQILLYSGIFVLFLCLISEIVKVTIN